MKLTGLLVLSLMAMSISVTAQVDVAERGSGRGPQETDRHETESLSRLGRWSSDFTIEGLTGRDGAAPVVYDFAQGPDGEVLATGRFQWSDRRTVDPIVQLRGNRWTSARDEWEDVPEIGFSAIAVSDTGAMALSTYSGRFGAVPVEVWLETPHGVDVIGQLQGTVRSMVWFDGHLWVAGFFLMEEGGVTNLAVWDGATWSEPPGGPADGAVYRLFDSGDTLLAAGDFTSIGGLDASHVAEWNGSEWQAYDIAAPIEVGHVYGVVRTEQGELFAAGAISGGLVQWTGAGWEPVGGGVFDGEFPGVVSDLVMHQGDLYITGCFSHLDAPESDPSAIRAESVARWTGSQWESLDDGSQPIASTWVEANVCGFEPNQFTIWEVRHQRLFSDGERVFVGGHLPGAGGVASQSVVSFDGAQWRGFGRGGDGLSGSAQVVTVGGRHNAVHVLGGITHAGGTPGASGIFRYDRHGWTPVGGPLPSDVQCAQLAADRSGRVFVGCTQRSTSQDPPLPVVLTLDDEDWVPLEPLGLEGTLWDMRLDADERLWIAGGVRTEDDSGSGYVARWDEDGFTIIEDGFNSMVFGIAFPPRRLGGAAEPDVVVAGAFTEIGGEAFARIARLRGDTWEPLGPGLGAGVLAVAWSMDGIYASTEVPVDPEGERTLLGRWDGGAWEDVATPEHGLPPPVEGATHSIQDLLPLGRGVVAVGSLWPETDERNVFVYDGRRVSSLGGGLNAISVSSVALARDGLWFAGQIAEAGSGDRRIPSIGIARFRSIFWPGGTAATP